MEINKWMRIFDPIQTDHNLDHNTSFSTVETLNISKSQGEIGNFCFQTKLNHSLEEIANK